MLVFKKVDNLEEEKGAYKEETNLENKKILIDLLLNLNNNHIKKSKWIINIIK